MRARFNRSAASVVALSLLLSLLPLVAASAPRFSDVPASNVFYDDIAWLADAGITRGCNPPNNSRFCPDEHVTRGQMAAFLVRALGLPAGRSRFADTASSVFAADIAALADAGITRGCNPPNNSRFCPDDHVTRGQMAAFLVRALDLPAGKSQFSDTAGSVFAADISALADAGITRGCNPPNNDRFCPDEPVTRGQMAAFLHRALGGDTGTGGGTGGGGKGGGSGSGGVDASYDLSPAKLVTVGVDGKVGNYATGGWIFGPGMSASFSRDGKKAAFQSLASNLVPGDTNEAADVFVVDEKGKITRVSVASDGTQGVGGDSLFPAMSADGTHVAFVSDTPNLTGRKGDDFPHLEVMLKNLVTGELIRVAPASDGKSQSSNGSGGTGLGPDTVGVSHNGRYVVFVSESRDLVDLLPILQAKCPPPWSLTEDRIYLRDTWENKTTLITDHCRGNAHSPTISADGSTVAFVSEVDLIPSDKDGQSDVYLWTASGGLEVVSIPPGSTQFYDLGPDWRVQVSRDGRYVLFAASTPSSASSVDNAVNLYLRDRQAGSTRLVAEGVTTSASAVGFGLSDDGRWVVFQRVMLDICPNDSCTTRSFLWDAQTGKTVPISRTADLQKLPSISGNGQMVAFISNGTYRDLGRETQLYLVNRSAIR